MISALPGWWEVYFHGQLLAYNNLLYYYNMPKSPKCQYKNPDINKFYWFFDFCLCLKFNACYCVFKKKEF